MIVHFNLLKYILNKKTREIHERCWGDEDRSWNSINYFKKISKILKASGQALIRIE